MVHAVQPFSSQAAAYPQAVPARPRLVAFGCASHDDQKDGDNFRAAHSKKDQPDIDARIARETNVLKRQALKAIRWYQKNDFIHDKVYKAINLKCAYALDGNPSCSQYTLQAIEKYGVVKGCWLGFWRIMNCNPLSIKLGLTKKYFTKIEDE